mgnify:CR=1 FL=1
MYKYQDPHYLRNGTTIPYDYRPCQVLISRSLVSLMDFCMDNEVSI